MPSVQVFFEITIGTGKTLQSETFLMTGLALVQHPKEQLSEIPANLAGLWPYTTYSISMSVLSSAGESLPTDLYKVTLEAGRIFTAYFFIFVSFDKLI